MAALAVGKLVDLKGKNIEGFSEMPRKDSLTRLTHTHAHARVQDVDMRRLLYAVVLKGH